MNPAIIIPTFHQAAADRDKSLAESIYDHPTPLDAPGTLERCLESLQKVQGLGQIIITVSHNEAVEKVKGIVDRFPQMHTLVISESGWSFRTSSVSIPLFSSMTMKWWKTPSS